MMIVIEVEIELEMLVWRDECLGLRFVACMWIEMLTAGSEVIVTHRRCICLFARLFFLAHLLIYL